MDEDVFVLPSLVLMQEYENNWEQYLDAIYRLFCRDFVHPKPKFEQKPFRLKRHPLQQGKEATFWHIISEGEVESERVPDLRRCERILWPRVIIENMASNNVKCWRNERKGEGRIVIATLDFSYVVILADRGAYVLLWTAYCVERTHQRRKLQREYEAYLARKD